MAVLVFHKMKSCRVRPCAVQCSAVPWHRPRQRMSSPSRNARVAMKYDHSTNWTSIALLTTKPLQTCNGRNITWFSRRPTQSVRMRVYR